MFLKYFMFLCFILLLLVILNFTYIYIYIYIFFFIYKLVVQGFTILNHLILFQFILT